MSPRSDLYHLLRKYANEAIDLATLVDELSALAIPISKADDSEARSLAGLAWRLVSEYDLGHRTEPSVRSAIRAALRDSVSNPARA